MRVSQAMAPDGQAALQEVMSEPEWVGLQGAGPLLSRGQTAGAASGVARERRLGLLICSDVAVSWEMQQVLPGK